MIKLIRVIIDHDLHCNKVVNAKVIGNKKVEIIYTDIDFESEKDICKFWRSFANERGIDKNSIFFYTVGDNCVIK